MTNFFTSFGYLQDAEDDRTVLSEARVVQERRLVDDRIVEKG